MLNVLEGNGFNNVVLSMLNTDQLADLIAQDVKVVPTITIRTSSIYAQLLKAYNTNSFTRDNFIDFCFPIIVKTFIACSLNGNSIELTCSDQLETLKTLPSSMVTIDFLKDNKSLKGLVGKSIFIQANKETKSRIVKTLNEQIKKGNLIYDKANDVYTCKQ